MNCRVRLSNNRRSVSIWLLNFAPAPSRDETNPSADLDLQILRDGVLITLEPDLCCSIAQEKPTFLNLFVVFFT